jgi:hypothetical protein
MCLIALLAWLSPRLAIVAIWLFSDRMAHAFQSFWVAFLGFLFLPWTTLAWAVVWAGPRIPGHPTSGIQGFGWFLVILAFLVDLASYAAGGRGRRRRAASYS